MSGLLAKIAVCMIPLLLYVSAASLSSSENSVTKARARRQANTRTRNEMCDFSNSTERIDCGWPGITQRLCEDRRCCFDQTSDGHWCFYGNEGSLTINNAFAGTDSNGNSRAETAVADWNIPGSQGNLVYAKSKWNNGEDGSVSVGFINFKEDTGLLRVENQVLTAGAEVGLCAIEEYSRIGPNKCGVMVRAIAVDGTLHVGPVGVNYGVTADTGILLDRGIEVKFLGIGGKVGAQGIQACFYFCFGISW